MSVFITADAGMKRGERERLDRGNNAEKMHINDSKPSNEGIDNLIELLICRNTHQAIKIRI